MDTLPCKWTQSMVVLAVCYLSLPIRGSVWWPCSSECARCLRQTTPLEELLLQYYPGLFSPVPPSHSLTGGQGSPNTRTPAMYSRLTQNIHTAPRRRPHPQNSRVSHQIVHGQETPAINLVSGSNIFNNTTNKINGNETASVASRRFHEYLRNQPSKTFIWNVASRAAPVRSFQNSPTSQKCCETIQEYVTPPNVTVDGKVYRVVHLRQAFQFIPVAKCRQGTTCIQGECVERFRAHWVLVYNSTKSPGQPPVSFTPVEVPSHCECLNVGRP